MAADACVALNPNLRVTILAPGAGNSPFVHGFNMPLHPQDSIECFEQDVMASGYGQSDSKLVKVLCGDSLDLMPMLEQLGIRFNTNPDGSYQLLRPLGSIWPRVVSVGNDAGGAIISQLKARLKVSGNVTILKQIRAIKLLKDDKNSVIGALCYQQDRNVWVSIFAGAVILASGGYSNIYRITTNAKDLTGDTIAMAYDAGAELTDLEFIQFEPSVAVSPDRLIGKSVITTMFFENAVLRNRHGERFMLRYGDEGERVGKDVMSRYIAKEIAEGNGTDNGGVLFDATGVGEEKLKTVYHAYYQRYLNVGINIAETPMEIAPAPHTALGGVFARPDCSTNLKGLFVCGEALGGLHGANRIGGNAGLETLVFGRIAGKSAALFATENAVDQKGYPDSEQDSVPTCTDTRRVRDKILNETAEAAGVIRTGPVMKKAMQSLELLCSELSGQPYSYETMRLYNDARTAYLVVRSAYERKGSVGCHYRTDSIEEADKYRIVVFKGDDGLPVFQRKTL